MRWKRFESCEQEWHSGFNESIVMLTSHLHWQRPDFFWTAEGDTKQPSSSPAVCNYWKSEGKKTVTIISFNCGQFNRTKISPLQVTSEHQVTMIQQTLFHQYSQPANMFTENGNPLDSEEYKNFGSICSMIHSNDVYVSCSTGLIVFPS